MEKEEIASLFLVERLSISLTKIRVHSPLWFYQRKKKKKKEDDTDFSVKNEKVPSAHKQRLRWDLFFLWFFLGKLDLLYAFNFFNLVLDFDSKIRAKEIRF